jgi:hypothetical protein
LSELDGAVVETLFATEQQRQCVPVHAVKGSATGRNIGIVGKQVAMGRKKFFPPLLDTCLTTGDVGTTRGGPRN